MPPIPSIEGAFYTHPNTKESAELDVRWRAGDFGAKVIGSLRTGSGDKAINLYVPQGTDPRIAGGWLALNQEPPAIAYFAEKVMWYPDDCDPIMEEAEAYLKGEVSEEDYFKRVGRRAVALVESIVTGLRRR